MSPERTDPSVLAPLARALLRELLRDPEALAELAAQLKAGDAVCDQDSLPETVSRRAFLLACRTQMIPGAVKHGRRWVAKRAHILGWWLARTAAVNDAHGDEDDAAIAALRAAGYVVDDERARRVLKGR